MVFRVAWQGGMENMVDDGNILQPFGNGQSRLARAVVIWWPVSAGRAGPDNIPLPEYRFPSVCRNSSKVRLYRSLTVTVPASTSE